MDNKEFSFTNKSAIKAVNMTLSNMLNLKNNPTTTDNDQIHRTKSLLTQLENIDDAIALYLDEHSTFSRNYYKDLIGIFNTFSKANNYSNNIKIDDLAPHSLPRLFLFMALLSKEITHKHYSKIPTKNVEYAQPLLVTILCMEHFSKEYESTSKQDSGHKNFVRHFIELIQNVENIQSRREIEEKTNEFNILYDQAIEKFPQKIEDILQENAVKLGKSFNSLLNEKKEEKLESYKRLQIFGGALLIAPLLTTLLWMVLGKYIPEDQLSEWVPLTFKIISTITIEALLVYFFRIILLDYYGIKAEIIQLEIRSALTEFLPSYVAFSKDKADVSALEHFSHFIFKPLVANATDIPKITDGFEQATNLVKAVKQKPL